MKRRAVLATIGSAALVTALPRLAGAQSVTVRMGGVYTDINALPFYAPEAGAFAKAGFTAEPSALVNAGALVAAIGGGSLEMGIGDLISGVNALLAGVPIVLVAGGALYQANAKPNAFELAALKDSPIRSPRDFIGKTVAVPTLVGLTTASVKAWLVQNGVPVDQVKLIEFPSTGVVQGLERNTFEVAMVGEPFRTFYKDEIKDVGHPMDAIAPEFMATVWYASKAFMDADRARARRAIDAMYGTNRWANSHHDETFAILVREGKLDGSKVAGMARAVFATNLSPAQMQPVLDIGTKNKIFDHAIDASALITRY